MDDLMGSCMLEASLYLIYNFQDWEKLYVYERFLVHVLILRMKQFTLTVDLCLYKTIN